MSKELTQQWIGQVLPETVIARDAIHVAVVPIAPPVTVYPGQAVDPTGDPAGTPRVGIVDPFLAGPVYPGQRCFLFLRPNTITGLRHEWTHPAFDPSGVVEIARPPVDAQTAAQVRLKAIAEELDIGYGQMMRAAQRWLEYGDYEVQQGQESWRDDFPALAAEFWHCFELVRGVSVPEDKRESFFSCSC